MTGSKVTVAFIEFEIRQFPSAFSISPLALPASSPDFKVHVVRCQIRH
jgi:hypothetical protein